MNEKTIFRASLERKEVPVCVSTRIRENLFSYEPFLKADNVFIYVSLPTEPDTLCIIQALLRKGKRVAVPRCGPRPQMEARLISGLMELKPGKLGIPEPPDTAPEMPKPDIAVIPCLACDRLFHRIGHGAGYYDAYLSRTGCLSVCLCPSNCLFPEIPNDEYDIKPGAVITENRILLRS